MIKNILFQWMKMGINWLRVTSMNVMENGTGQNTAITLPPIIPTSSGLHLIESYLMQTVENSNFYVHFLMKISFNKVTIKSDTWDLEVKIFWICMALVF